MRIVCAMSGGVDSSLAAALLRDAGHEVIGMTMRLYDAGEDERRGRGGTCCSPAEVDLARLVCEQLGIPHYVVDERERFERNVIDPFARDYAAGRTPNPCTRCNQHVKFEPLLRRAAALGAEALATGHYARNAFGLGLRRGVDPSKDQSYFLFSMGRAALRRTWFPLGGWTKDAVRARAEALRLPNWDAPDSQELCFVPGGDHAVVVERRMAALGLSTAALAPGPVVDASGTVVGDHDGIHRVTIGQRRGFRTRGTERRYVLNVIPQTRTVVVGDAPEAAVRGLEVGELQRLGLPDGDAEHRVHVQWRHRSPAEPATVRVCGDRAVVTFDVPVNAAAPGQAAVFYRGDEVLGGGWIDRAIS
jgi:tRNA-specific 2-thiouridylase